MNARNLQRPGSERYFRFSIRYSYLKGRPVCGGFYLYYTLELLYNIFYKEKTYTESLLRHLASLKEYFEDILVTCLLIDADTVVLHR